PMPGSAQAMVPTEAAIPRPAATPVCKSESLAGIKFTPAQQLLVTANQQASLFRNQTTPFQVDVNFLTQMNVPMQGHFTFKWQAEDRWWRRIVMGDFEQIDILNVDRLYTSRNLNFTPVRIRELISLFQFLVGPERLIVKNQKKRVENGIEMVCLRV